MFITQILNYFDKAGSESGKSSPSAALVLGNEAHLRRVLAAAVREECDVVVLGGRV
jgi:hypothetical protein